MTRQSYSKAQIQSLIDQGMPKKYNLKQLQSLPLSDISTNSGGSGINPQNMIPQSNNIGQSSLSSLPNDALQARNSLISNLLQQMANPKQAIESGYQNTIAPLIGGLYKTGKGIGNLEAAGFNTLSNLFGGNNPLKQNIGMAPTSEIEQDIGGANNPSTRFETNLFPAILSGGASLPEQFGIEGATGVLPKLINWGLQKGLPQAGLGASLATNNPGEGAAFGLGGAALSSVLPAIKTGIGNIYKNAQQIANPTDQGVRAATQKWLAQLPVLRDALYNEATNGYNSIKQAAQQSLGEAEPFKDEVIKSMVGTHLSNSQAADFAKQNLDFLSRNYPELFDKNMPSVGSQILNMWPEQSRAVLMNFPSVERAFKSFTDNPIMENADNLKRAMNDIYPSGAPKTGDNELKNVISDSQNILKNNFINPGLQDFDAKNGTNLFENYNKADQLWSSLMKNFGKEGKDKLATLTTGGLDRFNPGDYKKVLKILDDASTGTKPVEIGSPVQQARNEIANELENYNSLKANKASRGTLSRTGKNLTSMGLSLPYGLSKILPLNTLSKISRPVGIMKAQEQ